MFPISKANNTYLLEFMHSESYQIPLKDTWSPTWPFTCGPTWSPGSLFGKRFFPIDVKERPPDWVETIFVSSSGMDDAVSYFVPSRRKKSISETILISTLFFILKGFLCS